MLSTEVDGNGKAIGSTVREVIKVNMEGSLQMYSAGHSSLCKK
jgi:hypothetical protein